MAFFRTVKIFNPLLKIVNIHKTTMPSKKPGIVVCNFFLYFVIPSNANKNAYSLALSFNTLKLRRRLGSWHTKQYFFPPFVCHESVLWMHMVLQTYILILFWVCLYFLLATTIVFLNLFFLPSKLNTSV